MIYRINSASVNRLIHRFCGQRAPALPTSTFRSEFPPAGGAGTPGPQRCRPGSSPGICWKVPVPAILRWTDTGASIAAVFRTEIFLAHFPAGHAGNSGDGEATFWNAMNCKYAWLAWGNVTICKNVNHSTGNNSDLPWALAYSCILPEHESWRPLRHFAPELHCVRGIFFDHCAT